MEDPTKEEESPDGDKIIKNETYSEEELREEYDPTSDTPENEPYNEPGEPDGH